MIDSKKNSISRQSPRSSDKKLYQYLSYEKQNWPNNIRQSNNNYEKLKKYTQYLRNQIVQLQTSNQFFAKRNLTIQEKHRKNIEMWKKQKQRLQNIIDSQIKEITTLKQKLKHKQIQPQKPNQHDFDPKIIMEQMKLLHEEIIKLQAITVQGITKRKTIGQLKSGMEEMNKREKSIISNLQPDTLKNLKNFRDRIHKLAAFTRKPKQSLTKQIRLSISKLKRKKNKVMNIPFIIHNDQEVYAKKCKQIQQSIDGYMNQLKIMFEKNNQQRYD